MDLIYMNTKQEDVGVLDRYTMDLALGEENDFECQVSSKGHCCEAGYYLYYEGTEYGGKIDEIDVNTGAKTVTYYGRTWHGILASKIICPDTGEAYLTLSGEANSVLGSLVERLGLSSLFSASNDDSGINISYEMPRYINGYKGIRKMLKSAGAKLKIAFVEGHVTLSAEKAVDYSQDEQIDPDLLDFTIKKSYAPINHVICLGQGELAEREVIHLYADEEGNVVTSQVFTGLDEVTEIYDYPNAESTEELMQGGIDIIEASWASDEVDFDFNGDAESYDIGDIIGATERITGISVAEEITQKIIKIDKGQIQISYKVGD